MIETILKTLTAAGSFLGTVAFVQNLSKEVTATNKAQWEKLAAIIGPADFDELQYDLGTDRIRLAICEKMHRLAYAIDKDDYSITGFKSLLWSRIRRKLQDWYILYKAFQQHVQVPIWNPTGNPGEWEGYILDKELFYVNIPRDNSREALLSADRQLNAHRDTVLNLAEQMEAIFVDIQRLANRDAFELVLPWKCAGRK